MDFSLSDHQISLAESLKRFAERDLKGLPVIDRCDAEFPWDAWKSCADMEIMALPVPSRYDGCGANLLTTAVALRSLGFSCDDSGFIHALATHLLCEIQLATFGTDEQKAQILPAAARGDIVCCQAITEPDSGTDALAMRTSAKRQNGDFLIHGSKTFISNGPIADIAAVFAVTDEEVQRFRGVTCFLVDCETDGLHRGSPFEKMGLSTLKNGELVFEGCRVPSNRILGAEGQGAIMMQETLEWERILFSAVHLGVLERTLRRCLGYVKQREAFGKPIGHYQSIANKIVEMKQRLELGELILYRSACLKDLGKRASVETSICKLHVSNSLKSACLDAVQIHGAYGYMRENPVERDLRDAVAATIYSGTTELQQNIIAKMMGI